MNSELREINFGLREMNLELRELKFVMNLSCGVLDLEPS